MRESRLTFLTGNDIVRSFTPELERRVGLIYMTAFGQILPGEGAVSSSGDAITLADYFRRYVLDSNLLKRKRPAVSGLLRRTNINTSIGSLELIHHLEWFEGLPNDKRTKFESEISQATGYRRYYQLGDVMKRFRANLTPKIDVEPAIFLWGRANESLTGFATSYFVRSTAALVETIQTIPYLYSHIADNIITFLENNNYLTFPFEWDSEAAAIEDQASGWKRGLYQLRRHALKIGCRHAAVITFEASQVYKGLKRQQSTQSLELPISSPTGEMVLVVTDVAKSVAELESSIS